MSGNDDDPADALYAAAPDDFVLARDALVKELKGAGDRAGAARVKGLRKPTRAAWAVNVAVREQPQTARELADAARRLQEAQQELLTGGDDASPMREADRRARAAADALAAAAPATDGPTAEKVRATLRAATADPDVLAEVLSGRLAREQVASGFGGFAGMLGAEAAPASGEQRIRASRSRAAPTRAADRRDGAEAAQRRSAGVERRRTEERPAAEEKRRAVAEEKRRAAAEEKRRAAAEEKRRAAAEGARRGAAEQERRRAEQRQRERLLQAREAEAAAEEAVTAARRALEQVETTMAERREELSAAEQDLDAARRAREQVEG